MSGQNVGSATFLSEPLGTVVEAVDWNDQQLSIIEAIGAGIVAQQGTLYARSLYNPLSLSTNNTMTVGIGGGNQRVLCDGYWCDGCPEQSFNVPAAPGSGVRVDAICIQASPLETTVGTVTRTQKNGLGATSPVTVEQVVNGVLYEYVQGDGSGAAPSAPAGYTRFITITVPAGTTQIGPGNWAYDAAFPEMNPQGPIGPNPLTTTSAPVVIPNVGQSVNVPVGNGASYPNGQYATVSDGAHAIYGQVVSGGTTATLRLQCLAILLGAAGQQIATGSPVAFAGPPGAQGAQGAQGIQGIQGTAGTNGTSPNPRGAWAVGTAYNQLDIVSFNGSSYIAVTSSTGVEPDLDNGSHWMLIAAKGATGATGAQGPQGAAGANGSQGIQGNPGTNGTNGKNAFATLQANVVIPAVGVTASISVDNAGPFPFGECVVISDGAQAFYAQVTATAPLTVKNLQTIAQGTGTVASGGTVTPAGVPLAGGIGSTYCNFQRVGSLANVTLQLPAALPVGTYNLLAKYSCLVHSGQGIAQLSGANGSWEAPSSSGTGSAQGASIDVSLTGTAIGGQQPSVSLSWPQGNTLDYGGVLEIWAVRIA